MTRITLSLSEKEKEALSALSKKELRDPHSQAILLIRQGLECQGFLPASNQISPPSTTSQIKQYEEQ